MLKPIGFYFYWKLCLTWHSGFIHCNFHLTVSYVLFDILALSTKIFSWLSTMFYLTFKLSPLGFALDYQRCGIWVPIGFHLDSAVWSWSYGSWIYNYLCNQCLSPLTLWVRTRFRQGVLNTTLCDKVCHWPFICNRSMVFSRVFQFPPPIKLTAMI